MTKETKKTKKKAKPVWMVIKKVHKDIHDRWHQYAEYHAGPEIEVYYFFNGQYYRSWLEFEKATNEAISNRPTEAFRYANTTVEQNLAPALKAG